MRSKHLHHICGSTFRRLSLFMSLQTWTPRGSTCAANSFTIFVAAHLEGCHCSCHCKLELHVPLHAQQTASPHLWRHIWKDVIIHVTANLNSTRFYMRSKQLHHICGGTFRRLSLFMSLQTWTPHAFTCAANSFTTSVAAHLEGCHYSCHCKLELHAPLHAQQSASPHLWRHI
jgi:hypothetical protein